MSDYLFAQPSFLSGVGRIFDFGGALNEYNGFATPEEADAMALCSDWEAVGQDISNAMQAFVDQHPDIAKAS